MERSHGAANRGEAPPLGTVFRPGCFGRMFPQLHPLLPPVEALNELAAAMVDGGPDAPEDARSEDNDSIPAGHTYLWQFIDYDITVDTTTLSEQPIDPQAVFNFRTPKLGLDSVQDDPESYLAQMPYWTPTLAAATPGSFTMADLLRFVDDLNPVG